MQKKPHDKIIKYVSQNKKRTPCLRPAGWGTDHTGEGKCKLHGGKSTGPRDKTKLKENKNAKLMDSFQNIFLRNH